MPPRRILRSNIESWYFIIFLQSKYRLVAFRLSTGIQIVVITGTNLFFVRNSKLCTHDMEMRDVLFSPESVKKFQQISEAYQVLSDPDKRLATPR